MVAVAEKALMADHAEAAAASAFTSRELGPTGWVPSQVMLARIEALAAAAALANEESAAAAAAFLMQ